MRDRSCPPTTWAGAERDDDDRVPYVLWAAQGFIEATAGNVVDDSAIEQRIFADAALFQVREIAYDPWNATL